MPDKYSLRLIPNVFKKDAKVTVKTDYFELKDQPCHIKLVEIDEKGTKRADIATFKVQVTQKNPTKDELRSNPNAKPVLRFTSAQRTDDPGTPPETAPKFKVSFDGLKDPIVEVAVTKTSDKDEGAYLEISMVVLDAAGTKELWPLDQRPIPFAHCSIASASYAKFNCKALNFNNDSVAIQKGGAYALIGVLDYARQNMSSEATATTDKPLPNRSLLITAHTDAVGEEVDNDALSDLRAKSVLALLQGDRQGYITACTTLVPATESNPTPTPKWCTSDVHEFLVWAQSFSWVGKLAPGTSGSDRGDSRQKLTQATAKALLQFDRRYKKQFKSGPEPTDPTPQEVSDQVSATPPVPDEFWGQMFDVYAMHIRQQLNMSPGAYNKLLKELRWTNSSAKAVGCGERYPLKKVEGSCEENRRIEFMFFTQADRPTGYTKEDFGPLYDKATWRVDPIACSDPLKPKPLKLPDPTTKDVLFVIDVSGSMSSTDGLLEGVPENTRLGRVKKALLDVFNALPATGLTNVLAYDGGGPTGTGGGTAPVTIRKWNGNALTTKTATPGGKSLTAWVGALTPGGSTPTGDALKEALEKTTGTDGTIESCPKELTVYLLSDGAPNGGASACTTILNDAKTKRASLHDGWKIDTVGFTSGDGGGAFTKFLQDLADQNKGTFYPI
jgi:hypothetical protein